MITESISVSPTESLSVFTETLISSTYTSTELYCTSLYNSSTQAVYLSPVFNFITGAITTTSIVATTPVTLAVDRGTAFVHPITIAWHSQDLPILRNSSLPNSSLPASHKTLSGGGIAGVVIGVLLFISALAFGFILFLRRRRLRYSKHQNNETSAPIADRS
jgi:hypothetical protein